MKCFILSSGQQTHHIIAVSSEKKGVYLIKLVNNHETDSLNPIVGLGAAKAVQNPESSTFYALAYYLGQNTVCNSKSAKRLPVTNPKQSTRNPDVRVLAIFQ